VDSNGLERFPLLGISRGCSWAALRPPVQAALTRWIAKAPLDFRTLIDEPTPASAYADIRCPILILRSEHAPKPTRLIAETLPTLLPAANLAVIDGTGHMGPLTHVGAVSSAIARHVVQVDAGSPPGRGNCRPPGAARRDVYAAVEVV
jgi:pimeloyl-ACP methyl ester carboxylesterase